MSASTITAFAPVAEGSELTPGFFNSRLQTLQDNIVSINSVIPGPSVLSGSTWASIGLFANSANSDYIRFNDSSNQRSTYRIGSNAGGTADGLNIYDESGSTMLVSFSKQSIRFYQNVVGPVFDVGGALASTYNAGTFGTGAQSKESRIQAAISAASLAGVARVYVPANMYPYSAGSVTFASTVQMVREGGNWAVYDVRAYGASADGVADDTTAISQTLSALTTGGVLYLPAGVYRLTSGGFNVAVPRITIYGDGNASVISASYLPGSNEFVFVGDQKDDVIIRDLNIQGVHAGGVRIANAQRCKIQRLSITGSTLTNSQGFCAGIYVSNSTDITVEGCSLSSNGSIAGENHADIVFNIGSEIVSDSRIINNICQSNLVNYNIGCYDPRNVLIQGNTCSGATVSAVTNIRLGYGIMLYHSAGISLTSVGECRVIGNHVSNVSGCAVYVQGIKDTVISENVIHDFGAGQDSTFLSVAGIGCESPGCIITNNRIYNALATSDGVSVTNPTNRTIVSGNLIENIGGWGVAIRGTSEDILVGGNSIRSVGVGAIGSWSDVSSKRVSVVGNSIGTLSKANTFGIYTSPTAIDWTVIGNVLTHTGGQAMLYDLGVNTQFNDNRLLGATNTLVPALLTSSGSVLGPSFAFSSESSLGFYRSAVSTIAQSFGTTSLQKVVATAIDNSGVYHMTGSEQIIRADSAAAARSYIRLANTSGAMDVGIIGSSANALFTNDEAYSGVIGTQVAQSLLLGAGGSIWMKVGTAGAISFYAAATQLIPGTTSMSLRNNANTQDNLFVTDAGAVTSRDTFKATQGWFTSGVSVGVGGTVIPAISSVSSKIGAFVVQGSSSSFTIVTWAAAKAGDQIIATIFPDATASSISSGLVLHSHCTQNGQIEVRFSNVSTLVQNQSAKSYYFTRIQAF